MQNSIANRCTNVISVSNLTNVAINVKLIDFIVHAKWYNL